MPSLPLTAKEEQKVLNTLGLNSLEDLFRTVPPKIREKADFKLDRGEGYVADGSGLSEHELRVYFSGLANKNAHFPEFTHFLGGGIYDNIIPAIVNQLALRGEFLTCYTPYQPEISQGTLQYIFEFQTLLSRITGMAVANASMYDGATATSEAILMAQRLSTSGSQRVFISASTHPEYQAVANTFLRCHSVVPTTIPWNDSGTTDLVALEKMIRTEVPCAVVIPFTNYFGLVEPIAEIKRLLPRDCRLVVTVQDLSALALYEPPGNLGADIVVGEGHQLGTPMLFGGPHVGFFATRKEFLRQMPGRLVGETSDSKGRRAYTLTLSTREQHIRRDKATSNICTNQGLIALRTAIYLSFLGKQGFVELGENNFSLLRYLTDELGKVGIRESFGGTEAYREAVFEVPNLEQRFQRALARKIIPGIRLAKKWPGQPQFSRSLLISVNPKHTKAHLDALVEALSHD